MKTRHDRTGTQTKEPSVSESMDTNKGYNLASVVGCDAGFTVPAAEALPSLSLAKTEIAHCC